MQHGRQKYTRRRSFLQYQNSDFLFYLGWSGSLSTNQAQYNEGCSKLNYLLAEVSGFALKKWPISLAGVSSEPFQGFWAYLGPHGITPGAVAQFLGQEKNRGFSDFVLFSLVHREFPRAESGKSFDSALTYQDILLLL